MCFRPPSAGKAAKCPSCGTINPVSAKFCIKCKIDLTVNTQQEQQKTSKETENKEG
jgi:uncharacterized Zn finger protein